MRFSGMLFTTMLVFGGCGDTKMIGPTPTHDLSAAPIVDGGDTTDLTPVGTTPDLTMASGMCNPNPTDGTDCSKGCAATGQIGVNDQSGSCHCWATCPAGDSSHCPCGRACKSLYFSTDGGPMMAKDGACLPANGAGERCGTNPATMKPFGAGGCLDGQLCTSVDPGGMYGYCIYKCTGANDCPKGTACTPLTMGTTMVCVPGEGMGGKAVGTACMLGDICALNSVCDGATCKPQCDGPRDTTTCTGGTHCTAVTDGAKISAYVCK